MLGLSPDLHDFDQIREMDRPLEVPDTGLLCDLLWSDPDKLVEGWGENERGVSFTFGADVVTKFLNKHSLDLVCRAHQVMLLSSNHIYKRLEWHGGWWGWEFSPPECYPEHGCSCLVFYLQLWGMSTKRASDLAKILMWGWFSKSPGGE